MTTQTVEPYNAPENDTRRGQWRLLTGLLAGPVVYSLYFMAIYLLVEAACREALLQGELWGLNALRVAVVGLTIAAVVIMLALTFLTYPGGRHTGREDARRNQRFMAQTGLWLSGFFVVVTLVTGIPILVLELCSWV